jgi:hypothetical protein
MNGAKAAWHELQYPTVGSKQYIVHGRSSFSTVAFNTKNKIERFCMVQQPQFFDQNYMLGLYLYGMTNSK